MSNIVTLIVDLDFKGDLSDIIQESNIWIAGSPQNASLIQDIWKSKDYLNLDEGFELTSFTISGGESPEEVCGSILDDVFIHHPECSELRIVGIRYNDEIEQELQELGAESIVDRDGVVVVVFG